MIQFLLKSVHIWKSYSKKTKGSRFYGTRCSLMFFMHVFNVLYKTEKKHVFYVFYLQINVFNIYDFQSKVIIKTSCVADKSYWAWCS